MEYMYAAFTGELICRKSTQYVINTVSFKRIKFTKIKSMGNAQILLPEIKNM